MRAGAPSLAEYKRALFSEERLASRLTLFRALTAESLACQAPCDADLYFVVLTAETLPTRSRASLDDIVRGLDDRSDFTCTVLDVPEDIEHSSRTDAFLDAHFASQPDQRFATVRLDDDDALAATFCRRLSLHLTQGVCGYPISFAYGYDGVSDADGAVTDLRHWNRPKSSAGLAFANAWSSSHGYADPRRQVYNLGRHTKVDVADALVVDTRAPAYLKTVNVHMDSSARKFRTDLPAVAEHEFAMEEFPFLVADQLDLAASSGAPPGRFDPALATSARARHLRTERELNKELRRLQRKVDRLSRRLRQARSASLSGRLESARRRVRHPLRSSRAVLRKMSQPRRR